MTADNEQRTTDLMGRSILAGTREDRAWEAAVADYLRMLRRGDAIADPIRKRNQLALAEARQRYEAGE